MPDSGAGQGSALVDQSTQACEGDATEDPVVPRVGGRRKSESGSGLSPARFYVKPTKPSMLRHLAARRPLRDFHPLGFSLKINKINDARCTLQRRLLRDFHPFDFSSKPTK